MATSGSQHDVDAQETEQPQNKRPRLAGDGESNSGRPWTASEPKAAGFRGEQSTHVVQGGSRFEGNITVASGTLQQGNITNIYSTADSWPAGHSAAALSEENGSGKRTSRLLLRGSYIWLSPFQRSNPIPSRAKLPQIAGLSANAESILRHLPRRHWDVRVVASTQDVSELGYIRSGSTLDQGETRLWEVDTGKIRSR